MSEAKQISLLGIPYDANSSYLRGAAEGPDAIRKALHSPSANLCTENLIDLTDHPLLHDRGNIHFERNKPWLKSITQAVDDLIAGGNRIVSLGGDHSITYPIIKGFARHYQELTIVQIDAHGDLYEEYDGNRYSHACPFSRIMEERLAKRLIQIGIRTMTPHQQQQVDRFGVEVFDMQNWPVYQQLDITHPIYLTVDLDALDPAFAPGVSHHEPGGLSTRELLHIIQSLPGPLAGADVVELNPGRDLNGVTAMVAAKVLKEIIANMLS